MATTNHLARTLLETAMAYGMAFISVKCCHYSREEIERKICVEHTHLC